MNSPARGPVRLIGTVVFAAVVVALFVWRFQVLGVAESVDSIRSVYESEGKPIEVVSVRRGELTNRAVLAGVLLDTVPKDMSLSDRLQARESALRMLKDSVSAGAAEDSVRFLRGVVDMVADLDERSFSGGRGAVKCPNDRRFYLVEILILRRLLNFRGLFLCFRRGFDRLFDWRLLAHNERLGLRACWRNDCRWVFGDADLEQRGFDLDFCESLFVE